MNDFDPIDRELISAGRDLDLNISDDIPPFKPRSDMPARIAVVGATFVVFGLGAFGFTRLSNDGEKINTDFASQQVEPDFDDSTATPDETGTSEDALEVEVPDSGPIEIATTDASDLVADKVYRPQALIDRPTTANAVRDEQFGVSIQAVTEAEPGEAVLSPVNASLAWNSDGSSLILYRTGGSESGHLLLDGNTYQQIGMLAINPLDVQMIYWDPTDSNRFYYIDAETFTLISFDVSANVGQPVHQFDCDDMNSVGFKRLSADGRIFAHNCSSGSENFYVAYDLATGTETRAPADSIDAPQPTPTSGLFVANSEAGGTQVLDSSLNRIRSLPLDEYADSVVIETPDGRDLLIASAYASENGDVGSVVAFDLATGAAEVIVGTKTDYPYPPSNTAITTSVGNSSTVVVSIRGTGSATGLLDGELLMVEFGSESTLVSRLGHHRSTDSVASLDEYWSRPGIALDPSSQRVLYSSDWGGDRVDSFVIDFGGTK